MPRYSFPLLIILLNLPLRADEPIDIGSRRELMIDDYARAPHIFIGFPKRYIDRGATIYEMLALQPAFPGEDDRQELLRQIAMDDPRPPRRCNASIPADLATSVLTAMAVTPLARTCPTTCGDF